MWSSLRRQSIQQLDLQLRENESWRRIVLRAVDHRQPEDPPAHDAEDGDEVDQSLRRAQLGFLGLAAESGQLI